MWKNYFKIAVRNLLKHRLYTAINLIGLSIGLGVGILVFIFVQRENTFDTFHQNGDRIARVLWQEKRGTSAYAPMAAPQGIKENVSGVATTSHFLNTTNLTKLPGGKSVMQQYYVVGQDFLNMFSFPSLKGERNPLGEKHSVAITEKAAKRYFGNDNPIGKTLLVQLGPDFEPFVVKTVLKNPPQNSSIQFEVLLSDKVLPDLVGRDISQNWFNTFGGCFVMLSKGTSLEKAQQQLSAYISGVVKDKLEKNDIYQLKLQPIHQMHLDTEHGGDLVSNTDPQLLWILASVALLILLIASINFTTLAIGRSASRAREVGVRKVMGAAYKQLIMQFMTESFVIILISTGLGIVLAELLLPVFNNLFEKSLVLDFGWAQWGIVLALMLLITLVSGAYPALFLSNLRPVQVLKSSIQVKFGKQGLRKALVGVQFFISLFLIACTLIMYRQMKLVKAYNLGFNKDNVITVNIPATPQQSLTKQTLDGFQKAQQYKFRVEKNPEVAKAGIAIATYGNDSWWRAGFPTEDGKMFYFRFNIVDPDYAKVLGLRFKEGRDFSIDFPSDSNALILNEAMASALKMNSPLQEQLKSTKKFRDHHIIGVTQDFHYASLFEKIKPAMLVMNPKLLFSGITDLNIPGEVNPKLFVKASTDNLQAVLAALQKDWQQLFPEEPFEYGFLDEAVQAHYKAEDQLEQMVTIAAIIAIVIASMGLFSLTSLAITGRMKEIGVRKVLGASAMHISVMFNREFLKITLLGVIAALPVSYWLMGQWLEKFKVKAAPVSGALLLTIFLGVLFTILIVSFQTVRASWVNPVKTLKEE